MTYIDSGVLIAAYRGPGELAGRAREVLDDPERTFASSDFVRLEVLPKAVYNRSRNEVSFYEAFFEAVSHWAGPVDRIVETALAEAKAAGLNAMDALHVTAAVAAGASELVTTEKPDKPIHRATSVAVRSVHPYKGG